MDRNERNTMDQNARKRTVRREGNAEGSARANEGLGRRPSGKAVRHLYEEHRKAAIRPEEQRRAERLLR